MEGSAPQRLGIAGLLAFEAVLTVFLVSVGGGAEFVLVSAGAAAILVLALLRADGAAPWMLGALALLTLVRAALQAAGGLQPIHVPSFLVPVGFALAALTTGRQAVAGIALVGLNRGAFAVNFLLGGNLVLGLANVLGFLGGVLWAKALHDQGEGQAAEEARRTAEA
jgi:hypothetical protein